MGYRASLMLVLFKWVLLGILIIGPCTLMKGQDVWTIDQFLDYSDVDVVLPFAENLNFLNNEVKGMPLVDNYEFRTETDEMELARQQFQLRFEFNSKDERKAYDRILAVTKEKYLRLQQKEKMEWIESRYNGVIDIHFLQREMELMMADFELLYDKRKVLKKIIESQAEVDVEEWITNENELFELRADSLELELQKKELSKSLFSDVRALPQLESTNLIQIGKLKEELLRLGEGSTNNPDLALVKLREEMADAEYQLEVAEANKWFNFAQVEYQADDRVSFQRELSFSTSIVIPHKNNNRVKKNDATLELLERSYQSKIEEEEKNRERVLEEAKFNDLIEQLEKFKQLRASQKLRETYDGYAERKLVSPLLLISIRRAILKNEKKQLELEKDIYEAYIDLLALKGAFLIDDKSNYITE